MYDGAVKGAAMVDLAPTESFEELGRSPLFSDPASSGQLAAFAQAAMAHGVQSRRSGNLAQAYRYHRFALYATWRLETTEGLDAAAGNVKDLRALLRDIVLRGDVDERQLTPEPTALWRAAYLQAAQETLALMRSDATHLLAQPGLPTAGGAHRVTQARAWRRLHLIAEDSVPRREALRRFLELADLERARSDALLAVVEELEQTTQGDLASGARLANKVIDEEEHARFAEVWNAYLRYRDVDDPNPELLRARDCAFRHFEFLRVSILAASGPIGHILSFALSGHTQQLGRDLVEASLAQGDAQRALQVAERLHARALGDLMSRTHYVPFERAPHHYRHRVAPMRGNVQSVEPASLREVGEAARDGGGALLLFLRTGEGMVAFVVMPDGGMEAWHTEECREAASRLSAYLPYGLLEHHGERVAVRDVEAPTPEAPVDEGDGPLATVWAALVPDAIERQLMACPRLTIVTDAELEHVPFCALRLRDQRHLVEQFEVVYWPSVTAGLATDSDYEARRSLAGGVVPPHYRGGNLMLTAAGAIMGAPEKRAATYAHVGLVLGNPLTAAGSLTTVGPGGTVLTFAPLAGAEQEADAVAARLGVPVLKREGATLEAVCRLGRDVRVLHFAAHGVASTENPRESFLPLADERLTAGELYDSGFGFGLRHDLQLYAGLVVLSGCQTGLGTPHPDSVIGLANGFLVAGANSVLSTLWRISDDATERLMTAFYALLCGDQRAGDWSEAATALPSVAAALQAAQLGLLRDPATAHPRFWAAFKLTGSARNPLTA